jgi:hypothetical protein
VTPIDVAKIMLAGFNFFVVLSIADAFFGTVQVEVCFLLLH